MRRQAEADILPEPRPDSRDPEVETQPRSHHVLPNARLCDPGEEFWPFGLENGGSSLVEGDEQLRRSAQ